MTDMDANVFCFAILFQRPPGGAAAALGDLGGFRAFRVFRAKTLPSLCSLCLPPPAVDSPEPENDNQAGKGVSSW